MCCMNTYYRNARTNKNKIHIWIEWKRLTRKRLNRIIGHYSSGILTRMKTSSTENDQADIHGTMKNVFLYIFDEFNFI